MQTPYTPQLQNPTLSPCSLAFQQTDGFAPQAQGQLSAPVQQQQEQQEQQEQSQQNFTAHQTQQQLRQQFHEQQNFLSQQQQQQQQQQVAGNNNNNNIVNNPRGHRKRQSQSGRSGTSSTASLYMANHAGEPTVNPNGAAMNGPAVVNGQRRAAQQYGARNNQASGLANLNIAVQNNGTGMNSINNGFVQDNMQSNMQHNVQNMQSNVQNNMQNKDHCVSNYTQQNNRVHDSTAPQALGQQDMANASLSAKNIMPGFDNAYYYYGTAQALAFGAQNQPPAHSIQQMPRPAVNNGQQSQHLYSPATTTLSTASQGMTPGQSQPAQLQANAGYNANATGNIVGWLQDSLTPPSMSASVSSLRDGTSHANDTADPHQIAMQNTAQYAMSMQQQQQLQQQQRHQASWPPAQNAAVEPHAPQTATAPKTQRRVSSGSKNGNQYTTLKKVPEVHDPQQMPDRAAFGQNFDIAGHEAAAIYGHAHHLFGQPRKAAASLPAGDRFAVCYAGHITAYGKGIRNLAKTLTDQMTAEFKNQNTIFGLSATLPSGMSFEDWANNVYTHVDSWARHQSDQGFLSANQILKVQATQFPGLHRPFQSAVAAKASPATKPGTAKARPQPKPQPKSKVPAKPRKSNGDDKNNFTLTGGVKRLSVPNLHGQPTEQISYICSDGQCRILYGEKLREALARTFVDPSRDAPQEAIDANALYLAHLVKDQATSNSAVPAQAFKPQTTAAKRKAQDKGVPAEASKRQCTQAATVQASGLVLPQPTGQGPIIVASAQQSVNLTGADVQAPTNLVAQQHVDLTEADDDSLFGDDGEEESLVTETTAQEPVGEPEFVDPDRDRIRYFTTHQNRDYKELPIAMIRAFIHPTVDSHYRVPREAAKAGNFDDHSRLLEVRECRVEASGEYEVVSLGSMNVKPTDCPPCEETRRKDKRTRKKINKLNEYNKPHPARPDLNGEVAQDANSELETAKAIDPMEDEEGDSDADAEFEDVLPPVPAPQHEEPAAAAKEFSPEAKASLDATFDEIEKRAEEKAAANANVRNDTAAGDWAEFDEMMEHCGEPAEEEIVNANNAEENVGDALRAAMKQIDGQSAGAGTFVAEPQPEHESQFASLFGDCMAVKQYRDEDSFISEEE